MDLKNEKVVYVSQWLMSLLSGGIKMRRMSRRRGIVMSLLALTADATVVGAAIRVNLKQVIPKSSPLGGDLFFWFIA